MNRRILDKILNEVSLDERVKNGVFSIEENDHMDALREYLGKRGMDEESIREFSNRVLEGKYPERQAYNAKGILVTFPTPEYKADAIKAGTHFEKDPTKGASNLFQEPVIKNPTPPPEDTEKPASPPKEKSSEPKTNLPVSQAASPASDDTPSEPVQAQTTAAPQQTPMAPGAPPEAVEPTELPPAPIKSPAEKEANKDAIKTMLKGDDYMLEMVTEWLVNNSPAYLMDRIQKNLLLIESDKKQL
jgi:hypothetical protein